MIKNALNFPRIAFYFAKPTLFSQREPGCRQYDILSYSTLKLANHNHFYIARKVWFTPNLLAANMMKKSAK